MTRYPHIATRLLNTPLAVHVGKAEIVAAALAGRLNIGALFGPNGEPHALVPPDVVAQQERAEEAAYEVVAGIAIIPIHGTLIQRGSWMDAYSGLCGYDALREMLDAAIADPSARAICLHVDSPGGEVSGCFDLVDAIHAARGTKPIWAICDEVAYSAAYAIASAADTITVPRTGGTGSIGVIAMLADCSAALEKEGITVNIIQFGDRKADGNPYQKLPDAARARFQANIDRLGEIFVSTVARNRNLSPAAVRGTQADCFDPDEALQLGLIDRIASPEEAFAALLATL